jgi:hypothetical protein
MLLLTLSCLSKKPPAPAPAQGPRVGVVNGPWLQGSGLALAATGPRDLEGGWAGPSIVLAAWIQQEALWTSSSMSAGRGWTPPLRIDGPVAESADGQARVEMGIASGRPVVAYSSQGVPRLASRSGEGWEGQPLSELARGDRLDLVVRDGEPVVAWLDTARGGVWILLDGIEEQVSAEAALACARPAVSASGPLQVAFRGVEGHVWRMRRSDEGWIEDEIRPGRAACDGPAFDGERLLSTEDGDLYVDEEALLAIEPEWTIDQPRAAGGLLAWREQRGGADRVVLGGQSLLTREGELTLGDPVVVAGEIWLPFQGTEPVVATFGQEALEEPSP